ncbi:hypothetical protein [Allosalinactinospora lopnorensis]|uniref:hypothetical protein n=1 Tax=Allosalinactinospora lopnorensis TaxID=1352348 RepID=UPI00069726FF|nr:hypothetical protein [Allosalinactinospora lopnorensis]
MNDTHPGYSARNRDGYRQTTIRRLATAITGRWPTYLGIALAVLSIGDGTPFASMIVAVAALTYLTVAVIDRPGAVWLVLVVLLAGAKAVEFFDLSYWVLFGPVALVATVVGLIGGQLRRPGLFRLQIPQMLVAGVVVVIAEFAGLEYAGYLVAAALLGHAIWDVAHWRADQVVTRSLAEFCAVIDSLLGLGLILLLVM